MKLVLLTMFAVGASTFNLLHNGIDLSTLCFFAGAYAMWIVALLPKTHKYTADEIVKTSSGFRFKVRKSTGEVKTSSTAFPNQVGAWKAQTLFCESKCSDSAL